jgi:hypothetical protein
MFFSGKTRDLIIIALYVLGFIVWGIIIMLLVSDWRPFPGKPLNIPYWTWKIIILCVLFIVSHFYWKIVARIQRPEIEIVLNRHLERYKEWSFASLQELIDRPDYVNVRTKSGEVFTLRFQAFRVEGWEGPFSVIKVTGSVEPGRKNMPDISSSFLIATDDETLDDTLSG